MQSVFAAMPLAVSLWCAVSLPCQNVLIVGSGGFPTIQAAVDTARDGDILRIAPGTYGGFSVAGKGLTLLADQPGTVRILNLYVGDSVTFLPAPGQQVRLVDLRFERNPAAGDNVVGFGSGVVSIEACTFRGGHFAVLNIASNSVVVMRHCDVQGDNTPVLVSSQSHLVASECTFVSGPLSHSFEDGSAIQLNAASAMFSACTMTGGAHPGGFFAFVAGSGVKGLNGSRLWLVDCTARGGDSATAVTPGGPAISNNGLTSYHRCTLIGGTSLAGPAPAIEGASIAEPQLGATSSPTVLQPGTNFGAVFTGEPGDIIVVLGTTELLAAQTTPLLAQPLLGFLAPNGIVVDAAVAGPQGSVAYTFPVPNTAAVRHLGVWFRGIDLATWPLQSSTVVGGVIR